MVKRFNYIMFQFKITMLQETWLSTRPRVRVRLSGTKGIRPAKLLTGLSIRRISTARFLTESEGPMPGGRWTWEETTEHIVFLFTTATRVSSINCHLNVMYISS